MYITVYSQPDLLKNLLIKVKSLIISKISFISPTTRFDIKLATKTRKDIQRCFITVLQTH